MKEFFKRLFCRHSYQKIGFREESDRETRYSVRLYKCPTCEKQKWVDGRYDPYE